MNKIALITGATSGIGRSCAETFSKNNYDIIITGRRADRLEKIKNDLSGKYNNEVLTLHFDIRNKDECEEAIGKLSSDWKTIDVLVNNAGLAAGLEEFSDARLDDWEQMIDTNIKGLLYISRLVSNLMKDRKTGHIINVGSIAGYNVYPKGHVYCGTKHAVRAISEGMRTDLLADGVKVSSINPGMVETEFSEVRFKGDKESASKVYDGFDPLTPENVADTIFYMANAPKHVNLSEIIILPTAQANAFFTHKEL